MLIWRRHHHTSRPLTWRFLGRDLWIEYHYFLVEKYPRKEGAMYSIRIQERKTLHTFNVPTRNLTDVLGHLTRFKGDVSLSYESIDGSVRSHCCVPDWALLSLRKLVRGVLYGR